MAECFRCGVTGDKVRLFVGIAREGIVKICENCYKEDNIPLMKKPTDSQLKAAETPSTVYQRLSSMAGLNPIDHKRKLYGEKAVASSQAKEVTLRDIVDRTYQKRREAKKIAPDLVDNFHWVAMMGRRNRKLTQDQVAKAIGEREQMVQAVEAGNLPEDYHTLIVKLQSFLGVRLFKKGIDKEEESGEEKEFELMDEKELSEESEPQPPKKLEFKQDSVKNLKISDLREMKKKHEKKESEIELEEFNGDVPPIDGDFELSKEEIDKLVWKNEKK